MWLRLACTKGKSFFILSSLVVFFFAVSFPLQAKTLQEIEAEIQQKKDDLTALEGELQKAEDLAQYYESQKNNASSELGAVEAELQQIEAEIIANDLKIKKVKRQLKLKQLEVEERDVVIADKLIELYISYKDGMLDAIVQDREMSGFWKRYQYQESLLNDDIEGLLALSQNVRTLEKKYTSLKELLMSFETENEQLATKKTEIEGQVAYLSGQATYNQEVQSGIRGQIGTVQQDIEGLSAQQKKLIEEQQQLIVGADGGTKPLVSGEYYFYGVGQEWPFVQNRGHGLGFSQYGAKGGAEKGMKAEDIATYYYPGSYIASGYENAKAPDGTNIEDYISRLAEIPDKACGTQDQINERPDKYALDDPNTIWDCWPEESIKAQVIVSRSYALAGGTSQYFRTTDGKRWAATETIGKILKHNDPGSKYYGIDGYVVKAWFASDNSNGWGTGTHRNPVWCWRFDGYCGSGYSWLQGVNDSGFAGKGPYTDWTWRTNSYTMNEINSMLEWHANSNYYNSGNMRELLNKIGKFNGFKMDRDVSGRVAHIEVIGSSGSGTIDGSLFGQIYNLWVGNNQPSGEVDPIFSLTYYFVQH